MIVPMLRYSFLVYHADYPNFLNDIKDLGVVHVAQKEKEPTPEMQELFRTITDVDRVIRMLGKRKSHLETAPAAIEVQSGVALLDHLKQMEGELDKNQQLLSQIEKDIRQVTPWGDFSMPLLDKLAGNGLTFRFLICPVRKFVDTWFQDYPISVMGDVAGYRYFVYVINALDGVSQSIDLPGVDEVAVPNKALSQLQAEAHKAEAEIVRIGHEMDALAWYGLPAVENYLLQLKSSLDAANVLHQTTSEVEGRVSLVEGWVPKPKAAELNQYLDANHILSVSRKPEEDETVPVLLKNNRFNKVFEFIGGFYDMPNNKELDLTPFFAPFYMLFFGFSLGDAGYGLVLILAAALMRRKMPKMKSIFTLAMYLGLSTVVFGALTGTFFGINLLEADIPWLEKAKAFMIDTNQMFYLSLILGVIQILFGMVVKVVNISISRGFKYAYSTVGWLILIFGLGIIFGLKTLGVVTTDIASTINTGVLIIAGSLILLFNNPKRNVVMNFLVGLWDVYGMLTGLLGDLLSYIRLFALGVSSAILGSVFNMMAMNMKPDNVILGPIVMILILLVGHGITIFMSSLGAFVHPIRLTFVEFYKNAGFTGGGKRYKPFARESEIVNN
jgi:V/A-type H+-transporting ATPase subunit I